MTEHKSTNAHSLLKQLTEEVNLLKLGLTEVKGLSVKILDKIDNLPKTRARASASGTRGKKSQVAGNAYNYFLRKCKEDQAYFEKIINFNIRKNLTAKFENDEDKKSWFDKVPNYRDHDVSNPDYRYLMARCMYKFASLGANRKFKESELNDPAKENELKNATKLKVFHTKIKEQWEAEKALYEKKTNDSKDTHVINYNGALHNSSSDIVVTAPVNVETVNVISTDLNEDTNFDDNANFDTAFDDVTI